MAGCRDLIPHYGDRVLRVIYNATKEPSLIVTVYFDRAMNERKAMKIEYELLLTMYSLAKRLIESEQVQPGVILDFDESGKVVGVEIHQLLEKAASSFSFTGETQRSGNGVSSDTIFC